MIELPNATNNNPNTVHINIIVRTNVTYVTDNIVV